MDNEEKERLRQESEAYQKKVMEEWREKIKTGEAVKEFEKAEKEYRDGPHDLWVYLEDEFSGERDWNELRELLTKQLEKKKKKAKK